MAGSLVAIHDVGDAEKVVKVGRQGQLRRAVGVRRRVLGKTGRALTRTDKLLMSGPPDGCRASPVPGRGPLREPAGSASKISIARSGVMSSHKLDEVRTERRQSLLCQRSSDPGRGARRVRGRPPRAWIPDLLPRTFRPRTARSRRRRWSEFDQQRLAALLKVVEQSQAEPRRPQTVSGARSSSGIPRLSYSRFLQGRNDIGDPEKAHAVLRQRRLPRQRPNRRREDRDAQSEQDLDSVVLLLVARHEGAGRQDGRARRPAARSAMPGASSFARSKKPLNTAGYSSLAMSRLTLSTSTR